MGQEESRPRKVVDPSLTKSSSTSIGEKGSEVCDSTGVTEEEPGGIEFSAPAQVGYVPSGLLALSKILSKKAAAEHMVRGINEAVFLTYLFPDPMRELGQRLWEYVLIHSKKEGSMDGNHVAKRTASVHSVSFAPPKGVISESRFVRGCEKILSVHTVREIGEFFLELFGGVSITVSDSALRSLYLSSYQACHAQDTKEGGTELSKDLNDVIESLLRSTLHGKTCVLRSYVLNWISENCPRLLDGISRLVVNKLTSSHRQIAEMNNSLGELSMDQRAVNEPIVERSANEPEGKQTQLHPANVWVLSGALPPLYLRDTIKKVYSNPFLMDPHVFLKNLIANLSLPSHWLPLYESDTHGLSLNRFEHHVLGYRGPTVTVVYAAEGHVFVVACDTEWRESPHPWGGSDSMVLQLLPEFHMVERGDHMFTFNTTSRAIPRGLTVGKDMKKPVLKITKDWNLVEFRGIPLSLLDLQVYGCAGMETKEAQQRQKKWEMNQVEKQRRVKLFPDWNENPDKYLLELAGKSQSQSYGDFRSLEPSAS